MVEWRAFRKPLTLNTGILAKKLKQKDEWVRRWGKKNLKDSEVDESQGMFNWDLYLFKDIYIYVRLFI